MTSHAGRPAARPYRPLFAAVGLAVCLLAGILSGWPLDAVELRHYRPEDPGGGEVVFHAPVLLGRDITNTIIHSVQLTPVIDLYRIQEGRIWAWREKIMSHNAGLPSVKPERGRFVYDPPWMVVEGTGQSWASIVYRVGTETLGKNVLCVFPRPCLELWRELPGKRLLLQAVPGRLFQGRAAI